MKKKILSFVMATALSCSSLMAAPAIDSNGEYILKNVKIEDDDFEMDTYGLVTNNILGGLSEYLHAKHIAASIGYKTDFNNNILKFESVAKYVNDTVVEYDLNKNIGYSYNRKMKVNGAPVSQWGEYKQLKNMPVKYSGSMFIDAVEFFDALGIKGGSALNIFKGGTSFVLSGVNESLTPMTADDEDTIATIVGMIHTGEFVQCECSALGLDTHVIERDKSKYLDGKAEVNSLNCYLASEKNKLNKSNVKFNTNIEKQVNKITHLNEDNTLPHGYSIKYSNFNYTAEFLRLSTRLIRNTSEYQKGIREKASTLDSLIADYNSLADLYNSIYGEYEKALSRIK